MDQTCRFRLKSTMARVRRNSGRSKSPFSHMTLERFRGFYAEYSAWKKAYAVIANTELKIISFLGSDIHIITNCGVI